VNRWNLTHFVTVKPTEAYYLSLHKPHLSLMFPCNVSSFQNRNPGGRESVRRVWSTFLMRRLCVYSINFCWMSDIPIGDWNNFCKTLIAAHSVEEIITLQVVLLSAVICPPVSYWHLITLVLLLHTDNSVMHVMSLFCFSLWKNCVSLAWLEMILSRGLNFFSLTLASTSHT